jgi:uncharacterized protein (TIGR03067 family)
MIHYLPDVVIAEGVRYYSAPVPEAAPAGRDDVSRELEKLRGSWELVYWLYNGREQSLAEGRPVMSFADEKFTIRVKESVIEKGVIEGLAPNRTPKPYEYAPTEVNGRPATLRYPGIYILEGDLLVACIGYKGKRPEAFSAEAGSMNELVVYKRIRS